MVEQRMQQLTDQTEQQRENNEDWKLDLENNLLKLIKIKRTADYQNCNIKKRSKCGGRTLNRKYRNSRKRKILREG